MDMNSSNYTNSDSNKSSDTEIFCPENNGIEFNSEYCCVKYLEGTHAVLLTWKKFASFDNYRKPTSFALILMQKLPVTRFIIDARNGFEDDKADVEWGFAWLLPEMAKTGCKTVALVMNELNNDIGAEMDMWTVELCKYFKVIKYDNLEVALEI